MIQSTVYTLVHITVDIHKTRANYSRFHVSFVVDQVIVCIGATMYTVHHSILNK